jgi:hypothetical protein
MITESEREVLDRVYLPMDVEGIRVREYFFVPVGGLVGGDNALARFDCLRSDDRVI